MSIHKISDSLRLLLALGLYMQLAGVCFIADGSRYATITNLTLFAPALVALFVMRSSLPAFYKLSTGILIALCVWVICVSTFNDGSVSQPWRWLRLILYVGLYIISVALVMQNRELWRCLLLAVVCTAAIFAWLSLFQALYVEQRGVGFRSFRLDSWGGSEVADFKNPIVSALYYGVVTIVALYLSLHERGIKRLLSILALLGAALYCYFTYSRGVWMGVLAGALAYLAVTLKVRYFRWLLLCLTPLAAVALFLLGKAGGIDASYRNEIFWQWWGMIDTFLYWGAGAGADPNICIEELQRCFNQAHSLYLQFFYEYGALGLLLLLALVVSLAVTGWRHRFSRESVPLGFALMVFMLVVSIANYYVIFLRPGVFWIIFWLPVAILISDMAESPRSEGS